MNINKVYHSLYYEPTTQYGLPRWMLGNYNKLMFILNSNDKYCLFFLIQTISIYSMTSRAPDNTNIQENLHQRKIVCKNNLFFIKKTCDTCESKYLHFPSEDLCQKDIYSSTYFFLYFFSVLLLVQHIWFKYWNFHWKHVWKSKKMLKIRILKT